MLHEGFFHCTLSAQLVSLALREGFEPPVHRRGRQQAKLAWAAAKTVKPLRNDHNWSFQAKHHKTTPTRSHEIHLCRLKLFRLAKWGYDYLYTSNRFIYRYNTLTKAQHLKYIYRAFIILFIFYVRRCWINSYLIYTYVIITIRYVTWLTNSWTYLAILTMRLCCIYG